MEYFIDNETEINKMIDEIKEERDRENKKTFHPNHYKLGSGIEVMDIIEALQGEYHEGGLEFNVLKYIMRWRKKNGVEDLKKCSYYLIKLILLYDTGYREELIKQLSN